MITTLMVLDGILALVLILLVVLQSGKSAGLSGSIGGGAEVVFGGKRKGLDEILAKLTIIVGALFGLVTLLVVKFSQ